jgi:putative transposase
MKRRRYTPEQIVRKLREADGMLAEGMEVPEVAEALEVSEPMYHRWRAQYGGMKVDGAKRLKELERENTTLKQIVADKGAGERGVAGDREGTDESQVLAVVFFPRCCCWCCQSATLRR